MQEHPFFMANGDHRLFCIFYEPRGPARSGIVMCHPFAEEKLWSQRVFVSLARGLARNGYSVLRVDFMGHGDSEGAFSDATVATRLSDIQSALDHLKGKLPSGAPLGMAGLRLGATLASMAAETRADVDYLVLWEPIINGEIYMRQLLRINIATQAAVYKKVLNNSDALVEKLNRNETVNIDGYDINGEFYRQLTGIDLLDGKKAFQGDVLLVSIVTSIEKVNRPLWKLKQCYSRSSYSTVVEPPFWMNTPVYGKQAYRLFDKTLQWLRERE